MKYEVDKPYIHDGSDKCPLPEKSKIRYLSSRGFGWGDDPDIPWHNVLCFVPTYIPPQPIEGWVPIFRNPDGTEYPGAIRKSYEDVQRNCSSCVRIAKVREVTE